MWIESNDIVLLVKTFGGIFLSHTPGVEGSLNMSHTIKVDLTRHVGLSMALAAASGLLAGYWLSKSISSSTRSSKDSSCDDMAEASSVPDSARTNGSSDADLQRSRVRFDQQENRPQSASNGSVVELGEEPVVQALLVRLDLNLVGHFLSRKALEVLFQCFRAYLH